jgi:carbonic anhydrase
MDGRSFALELHLVNESALGELLVLGVLIRPGHPNPAYDPLIAALPARPGERGELTGLDALSLLPDDGRGLRYSYTGSLTTPPCSEGVRWHVFASELELSPAQIQGFTTIYESNNRPLQALNDRAIALGGGAQAA